MTENPQWIPQESQEKQQINSVPPKVPNELNNNKLPWFLWVLAGCGCLVPIFLILIVIVIVVINPAARIKQAQENTTKTATISAKNETYSWKTFTSKAAKFSIKYPSAMEFSGGADGVLEYIKIGEGVPGPTVIISVSTGPGTTPEVVKSVIIDGVKAIEYESSDLSKTKTLYFSKNSLYYKIEESSSNESDFTDLDKIVSTFKFL